MFVQCPQTCNEAPDENKERITWGIHFNDTVYMKEREASSEREAQDLRPEGRSPRADNGGLGGGKMF